ncbi:hypothetical protein SDC9_168757 [bioreactor metagenome]|uniref:Uncharacterized protein n=1 Tax=bioreactor metagenome TaxID=1076179 RepID=A0A645G3E3_9ZZZZ|nr:DUF896 domain-containing protein [Proteiniclasticum sp. QWL-01]UUM10672.1 DUF896 domain-containing protein [Clostridiaceae bacterium HFYG-1003]WFF72004.1 DUF896 domain-containing protein [Proteiniclasticum sp. QWL-01]
MTDLENKLQSMALDDLIKGINQFTANSRIRELTELETQERALYRKEYIRRIGRNLRATLDNTDITYADGGEDGSNS